MANEDTLILSYDWKDDNPKNYNIAIASCYSVGSFKTL